MPIIIFELGSVREVIIKIYQGERKLIKDNRLIGNFTLNNIRLKQKSGVIIKVEIYVDNPTYSIMNLSYWKFRNS